MRLISRLLILWQMCVRPLHRLPLEVATPNRDDLRIEVERLDDELERFMRDKHTELTMQLTLTMNHLERNSPLTFVNNTRQRIDDITNRLGRLQTRYITLLKERLQARQAALHAANPDAILARGYAIVTRSDNGTRVQSSKDVKVGEGITVQLHEDVLTARIEDKDTHEQYKRTPLLKRRMMNLKQSS